MSLWSRIANALRSDRLNRDIDEELEAHLEEAVAHGRVPSEARRAFGSLLRQREESLDIRVVAWLDFASRGYHFQLAAHQEEKSDFRRCHSFSWPRDRRLHFGLSAGGRP